MKKFISILMLCAFALTFLVACDSTEAVSTPSVGGTNENDPFIDEDGNYVPRHEVKDMGGRTFTIIVRGSAAGTYQSDDFTTESEMYGDLLNDAVSERNNKVAELYNVELVVDKNDNINTAISNDIVSTSGTYDAIMPTLTYLSTLATDAYLWDLNTISGFDAEAPWYDQNCSEAFSFNDQLYFTTGDITILNKVCTPSILFNKEMLKTYYPDVNLYNLVHEKKWTLDKMIELASGVYSDASGNGTYSEKNNYGMVGSYGDALHFYGASGEKICGKNADDLPYLAIGETERSTNIAKTILETLTDASKTWMIYSETFKQQNPAHWEISFEIFYGGRALFRPSAFSATTKLRKLSEIEFGILPHPLMDDSQENYYSYCGSSETAGIAIPVSAKDEEFSAYMIEAYSAWAKNYITEAYVEVNLKTKDARDNESEDMLDIIFDNIVYDMGECFGFGGIASQFSTLAEQRSSDIVSMLNSKGPVAEDDIADMIAMYGDNDI